MTAIAPTLPAGTDSLLAPSCRGAILSGPDAADYAIVYTSAQNDFTLDPAPLTITASSEPMTYGANPPAIIPQYSGFENGDSASSLSSQPGCTTTAMSTSSVSGSPYTSTCSGAVDTNYTINYVPGVVTLNPAPLTITATSEQVTYGANAPAITPQYSGFENGDSPSSLTGQPTCSTPATSASSVSGSPYTSTCSGAVDTNYTINYVPGVVTVNPAPLTITAASEQMTYGANVPAITPQYSGLVNGDSASSLSSQPTCATTATSASSPSPPTYSSWCSGASDPNYTISYVVGAVTVNDPPATPTPPAPAPPDLRLLAGRL